jgi:hypothetical protein
MQKSDDAAKPTRRVSERRRCCVCGAFLAPDRLAAEFPVSQEQHAIGRSVKDKRLTVREILRETAGPSPVERFKAGVDSEQSTARGGWLGWHPRGDSGSTETAADANASPLLKRFARFGRYGVTYSVLLDIFVMTAVAALIAAVVVHMVGGFARPSKIAARRSTTLQLASAPAQADTSSGVETLPATIGNWSRIDTPAVFGPVSVATYANALRLVRVWVQTCPSAATANAALAAMVPGKASSKLVGALERQLPHATSSPLGAIQSVVLDDDIPAQSPAGYGAVLAAPGMSRFAHARTLRRGVELITVASDSAADRDDFTDAMLRR